MSFISLEGPGNWAGVEFGLPFVPRNTAVFIFICPVGLGVPVSLLLLELSSSGVDTGLC